MGEKKRQKVYRIIMLIFIVALVTFVVTTVLIGNGSIKYVVSSKQDTNNPTARKLDTLIVTVTELLNEKYIGEVNDEKLIDGAINGLVRSLGDTYTEYYTKEELEDFKTDTLGNFVGIGVYLKANTNAGYVEIVSPMKNSPAEKAGLQAGDIVEKVNGTEYKAVDLEKLANAIKGEEGTEVTLTIKRGEEEFDKTIKRESVHINYVTEKMLEDNIGYIALETFDEKCADDFKDAYNSIINQGAKSLIVDLRNNGGGLVEEALSIADYFCDKDETLLITIDKDKKENVRKAENDKIINVPVVVLTNRVTASSSEILTGAIKEKANAKVVGEKTYGKGVIQELVYLQNGGALKVTSSEYYTPNRNKIHGVGITPDFEVSYEYNEEKDNQLEKAIEVIKSN